MDKFIKAMENNKGYDFIAEHYDELSKFELRNIILECLYNMDKSQCEFVTDTLRAVNSWG